MIIKWTQTVNEVTESVELNITDEEKRTYIEIGNLFNSVFNTAVKDLTVDRPTR